MDKKPYKEEYDPLVGYIELDFNRQKLLDCMMKSVG